MKRESMSDVLEELERLADDDQLTQQLDIGAGRPTTDKLAALLYRLAKEHVGWNHLERMVQELREADAFVLQNEPMADQALRLAMMIRRPKQ